MGCEPDVAAGERLVEYFRPFIEELLNSGLSARTIRKHIDNLWLLGGEIIRDLNQIPSLRKRPVKQLLLESVEAGGPLLYGCDSEERQSSFESTCRKFWHFANVYNPQPLKGGVPTGQRGGLWK